MSHTTDRLRILSINIRAVQGGAGRMGYDLHKRLQAMGHDVRLLYGYGSGIAADPNVAGEPEVQMFGSKTVVLANFVAHLLVGHELLTAGRSCLARAIGWADVVHLHAPHHWYMRWATLINLLQTAGKPVVITAHDWWLVSGRCGFVRDCVGWQRECGECGSQRFQDLPSIPDRSRLVRAARQGALRRLRDRLVIVCPSQHLQRDHAQIYPDCDVRFVPNALDREFEAAVAILPESERRGIVFCASDLGSPGKIDADMVRTMARTHGDTIEIVGRGNQFTNIGATVHGEVRDRNHLAMIFRRARALIFTSQMDNAPLTIIEALASGCHVVAYPSPAAAEMIELVGGRCAASTDEVQTLINSGREAELYGGIGHAELARRAHDIWSGQKMAETYLSTYRELVSGENRLSFAFTANSLPLPTRTD